MPDKTIEVPLLTAKMLCDLILKWLDEPEHKEWLEKEYPDSNQNGRDM